MKRCAFALAAALAICGCSRQEPRVVIENGYVFAPVDIQRSFIAMAENPDAKNVLLIGEGAKKCARFFDEAGLEVSFAGKGGFDLVVMACKSISKDSCARVASLLSDDGVLAWMVDVDGVTAAEFKKMLECFSPGCARLWMVGEKNWLITGSGYGAKTRLDDILGLFSREWAFSSLAEAKSPAVQHLFASYAGTREDVMPAFSCGDQNAQVRPEYFLTKEIPELDWLDFSGVDEDIAAKFSAEARSMQVVRRLAVEGSMLAESGKEQEAIDAWNRALRRNPREMFVLERLDRLDRNAGGFFEVRKILMAMKCYETMVLIDPDNPAPLNNFGVCLRKIGRLDIAERVFRRVEELKALQSR